MPPRDRVPEKKKKKGSFVHRRPFFTKAKRGKIVADYDARLDEIMIGLAGAKGNAAKIKSLLREGTAHKKALGEILVNFLDANVLTSEQMAVAMRLQKLAEAPVSYENLFEISRLTCGLV